MNKPLTTLSAAVLLSFVAAGCQRNAPADQPADVNSFESTGSAAAAKPVEHTRTIVVHDRAPAIARCEICGTVINVEELHKAGDGSNAIGTIAGAVIGGVVGHQFGSGRGNTVATAAGAAGGAYAGNRAEAYHNRSTYYRITVNMEGGGTRVIESATLNGVGVGSKVKVVGDALQPA